MTAILDLVPMVAPALTKLTISNASADLAGMAVTAQNLYQFHHHLVNLTPVKIMVSVLLLLNSL